MPLCGGTESTMSKDIIITIKGLSNAGSDSDTVELITAGKYYTRNGTHYFTYNESEITGMEGTKTIVKVEDKKVTLTRKGPVSTQLIFEEGFKYFNHYSTDFGDFLLGVDTRKVELNLGRHAGDIEVDYTLDIDHGSSSENAVIINYKEAASSNDKPNTRS
jgi:uncharacterized beta-barrel protein YwiB (DUF1934 family)